MSLRRPSREKNALSMQVIVKAIRRISNTTKYKVCTSDMQHLASSQLGDTFASVTQPNSQKCEWLLWIGQTTILAILYTSVSKVIEFIEERMPIASSLRRTINWSDSCPSHFKSCLVLLNYFQTNEDIEWHCNETHHSW